MIYESERCYVEHHTYGNDYWYIADPNDGYLAPGWPTKEAMIDDLRRALSALLALD